MKRPRRASNRNRPPSDEGSVLVELAFAIPIMTLIMVVIVDVGLIVREHQVIQNAAREGARFSCLPENYVYSTPPDYFAVRQRVVEYARQEGITLVNDPALIEVRQDVRILLPTGLFVYGSEVTVSYTRPMLIGAFPLLPTNSMTLTGRSLFRNLD